MKLGTFSSSHSFTSLDLWAGAESFERFCPPQMAYQSKVVSWILRQFLHNTFTVVFTPGSKKWIGVTPFYETPCQTVTQLR